jgi:hypothetical protein
LLGESWLAFLVATISQIAINNGTTQEAATPTKPDRQQVLLEARAHTCLVLPAGGAFAAGDRQLPDHERLVCRPVLLAIIAPLRCRQQSKGPTEVNMTSTEASSDSRSEGQGAQGMDMALEVVTLPVSDIDQAKRFYQSPGWRLDVDLAFGDAVRSVQFTPPHSPCSIHFGGPHGGRAGSVDRLILTVKDIDAARADLISRSVEVSQVYENRPRVSTRQGARISRWPRSRTRMATVGCSKR